MLLHFLVRPRAYSPLGKKKIFYSYENGLGAQRVKSETHEVLNKALKKWLLILRSGDVLFNESMLNEKTLEFTNELNIKCS